MCCATEISLTRSDILQAPAKDHLERRDDELFLCQPRLGIGAKGREDHRGRLEERLVRARRSARDQQIGGVRWKEVTVFGFEVSMCGVNVEVVGFDVLPQSHGSGAIGTSKREPRQAAP